MMGWFDEQGNLKPNPLYKSAEQGASTSVWAAVSDELENKGGLYFDDNKISQQKGSREEIMKTFTGFFF